MAIKISRSTLKNIIDHALLATAYAETERQAVRHIGATADRVAFGQDRIGDCGCPIVQAGLWDDGTNPNPDQYRFSRDFDETVSNRLNQGYALMGVLEVTDESDS